MEKEYKLKGINVDQVSKKIDEIWDELKTDPALHRQVVKAGVQPDMVKDIEDKIKNIKRKQAITVKKSPKSGIDAATAAVIVIIVKTFGPLVANVLQDLWDNYFLPRIKDDLGHDSIEA